MAAVSDWHPAPENTASFEAITLTNLIPVSTEPRSPGRHRAPTERRPGVAPGTRRLAYATAFVGLAAAVAIVAWGATRSTDQGAAQPLTPLGTVAPYPLTTVPPAPTDIPTPETSLADAGTYTAPARPVQPRVLTRRPTVTVRRAIPAPVVTTTSVPVTTSPVPTTPEVTTTAAEPEVQPTRWHRWRDRSQWRVRDSEQAGLLGITGP